MDWRCRIAPGMRVFFAREAKRRRAKAGASLDCFSASDCSEVELQSHLNRSGAHTRTRDRAERGRRRDIARRRRKARMIRQVEELRAECNEFRLRDLESFADVHVQTRQARRVFG